jgi:Tfp pilus assembly ATPase PilU
MIETGQKFGMCTLDMSLAEAVAAGKVSIDSARSKAADVEKLERLLTGKRVRPMSSAQEAPHLDVMFDEPKSETKIQVSSKPWH